MTTLYTIRYKNLLVPAGLVYLHVLFTQYPVKIGKAWKDDIKATL